MTVHCYTSFSFSYLDRARVLAESLRREHPDWVLWAVVTDREPPGFAFDLAAEPFDRVLWPGDLIGPDPDAWLFGHTVVEACTAVKGAALRHILDAGAEKVFYLDPDTVLFAPLSPMVDWLEGASILLTPHQVDPDATPAAILDNEVSSLLHGVFNLGFIAVRNDAEGRRFADWWASRLADFCHDRKAEGIFVDQKWCNLIPAFFDNVRIVRDPGYNVASWNLSRRTVRISEEGPITVNGVPLRFFHFTKLGAVGDAMTERYARDNLEVFEIWAWYRRAVAGARDGRIPPGYWAFGAFANGVAIPDAVRALYRTRRDLRAAFPHPYAVEAPSFFDWLVAEGQLPR